MCNASADDDSVTLVLTRLESYGVRLSTREIYTDDEEMYGVTAEIFSRLAYAFSPEWIDYYAFNAEYRP